MSLVTFNMKEHKKGFTIVELLIVVSVIGILSGVTLSVINPAKLQARARDSQRISDLKKIQTALEAYFSDFRSYPPKATPASYYAVSTLSGVLVPNYISQLPTDPKGYSAAYSCAADFGYTYRTNSTTGGTAYVLLAKMETTSVDYSKCSDSGISNCVTFGCSTCATYCHAVQNTF
ncbi:MAG: general secretion pathway protein G [candidate division WWE3 bacterium GW2011_GWE1_41_27]|uniref:General secretion pathway protein G n=3 Tax=Katanobacteria TaxID=422282 RepID=A0A0G1AH89_UNCKA|nr:MAG: general secretion pathway protein G [candidate division WWE3 bacterium GW2011_GWE1_41_27]KKS60319.1 MAG: general secretion pathway protein G [candidate division WWE3 bacterium GW2011_GWF2_42_42]